MNTRSKTLNMTEGSPLRLLILFAIPMLIGNLFQQVYNLADSMIVGRMLGADALAAVGSTGSVSFLFFSVCNGMGSGGGIVTARFFGAGRDEKVRKAITNTAYLMLLSSLTMGLISFFAGSSLFPFFFFSFTCDSQAPRYRVPAAGSSLPGPPFRHPQASLFSSSNSSRSSAVSFRFVVTGSFPERVTLSSRIVPSSIGDRTSRLKNATTLGCLSSNFFLAFISLSSAAGLIAIFVSPFFYLIHLSAGVGSSKP